jgi:hypothetical protein
MPSPTAMTCPTVLASSETVSVDTLSSSRSPMIACLRSTGRRGSVSASRRSFEDSNALAIRKSSSPIFSSCPSARANSRIAAA